MPAVPAPVCDRPGPRHVSPHKPAEFQRGSSLWGKRATQSGPPGAQDRARAAQRAPGPPGRSIFTGGAGAPAAAQRAPGPPPPHRHVQQHARAAKPLPHPPAGVRARGHQHQDVPPRGARSLCRSEHWECLPLRTPRLNRFICHQATTAASRARVEGQPGYNSRSKGQPRQPRQTPAEPRQASPRKREGLAPQPRRQSLSLGLPPGLNGGYGLPEMALPRQTPAKSPARRIPSRGGLENRLAGV
jgi:hypothetical protein